MRDTECTLYTCVYVYTEAQLAMRGNFDEVNERRMRETGLHLKLSAESDRKD